MFSDRALEAISKSNFETVLSIARNHLDVKLEDDDEYVGDDREASRKRKAEGGEPLQRVEEHGPQGKSKILISRKVPNRLSKSENMYSLLEDIK